jgi:hypothetical protein
MRIEGIARTLILLPVPLLIVACELPAPVPETLIEGQMSDHKGAAIIYPKAERLQSDRALH